MKSSQTVFTQNGDKFLMIKYISHFQKAYTCAFPYQLL